ncbi:MAG TPA: FMN-binding protein [Candidatus Bathyarchaeia archaeon]|nr:FMN-binding protein [Candidatus Bathyarchaeia archaeon]
MISKKTLVSLGAGAFIALTFVIYSIHQRNEGNQAVSRVTASTNTPSTTPQVHDAAQAPAANASQAGSASSTATLKDGSYTGKSYDAFYGYIQVKATVSGGKLTDVQFLDYPQDRDNSIRINQVAMPLLKQQAIQAQSAQVDGVSGATDTSQAFVQSLSDALAQARA